MSWATNKITVVAALTTLGYKEVPRNIDIERNADSLDHFHFTVIPVDIDSRNITSNALLTSDIIEFQIGYKIERLETRESVYDYFLAAIRAINTLSICMGLDGGITFEKKSGKNDNKYIGTVRFYIGAQSC